MSINCVIRHREMNIWSIVFVFILPLICSFGPGSSLTGKYQEAESIEDLAHSLFEAVRDDDFEKFKHYFANEEDYRYLSRATNENKLSEMQIQELAETINEEVPGMWEVMISDLKTDLAIELNEFDPDSVIVDLSKVEIGEFYYEEKQRSGIKYVKTLGFEIRYEGAISGLEFRDCARTERGWVVTETW